jgi:hypothetical protein
MLAAWFFLDIFIYPEDGSTYCIKLAPNLSEPVDKSTDWERFQSLASELISNELGEESDKAAHDFLLL